MRSNFIEALKCLTFLVLNVVNLLSFIHHFVESGPLVVIFFKMARRSKVVGLRYSMQCSVLSGTMKCRQANTTPNHPRWINPTTGSIFDVFAALGPLSLAFYVGIFGAHCPRGKRCLQQFAKLAFLMPKFQKFGLTVVWH